MLIVAGTAQIRADQVEQARATAAKMVAATVQEAGCISYSFAQDVSDPTLFRIFEEWETEDALLKHFETPHMAEFRAALPDLITAPPVIQKYTVTDVQAL